MEGIDPEEAQKLIDEGTVIDLYRLMEMRAGLCEAEVAIAKLADTVPSARQTVVIH
jgi:hypothetical protein